MNNYDEEFNRGKYLRNQGRLKDAEAVFEKLITRCPEMYSAYEELAYMALNDNNPEKSFTLCQEMEERFQEQSDKWIRLKIKTLKLLSKNADAQSYLLTDMKQMKIDPKCKAELLVRNCSVSESEIPSLLGPFDFPPKLYNFCKEYLRQKSFVHNRIKHKKYKIVSLGSGCAPAMLVGCWGLAAYVYNESRRLPFDLAEHASSTNVLDLLESDFSEYFARDNIYITGEGNACFALKSRNVTFNHDFSPNYKNDAALFLAELRKRVNAFRSVLRERKILFVHHLGEQEELSSTIIDRFGAFLKKWDMRHRLVVLNAGVNRHVSDNIVCLADRCKSFQTLNRDFSLEEVASEKHIVDVICDNICTCFPDKQEARQSDDDVRENANLHEIAAESYMGAYIDELLDQTRSLRGLPGSSRKIGAIVMNCNPFTLGHRYLIETARKQVDGLIVFVVEEDRSFFPFKDRYRLVCEGVADMDGVCVVRSGRFIISTTTFPLYFTKDNPDMTKFDASLDIEFFGAYIAPALGISVRFVGTEPNCLITAAYNRQMAEILPKHKVSVVEIPRVEMMNKPISASLIRSCIENKQYREIRTLVPGTTYDFLIDRGYIAPIMDEA